MSDDPRITALRQLPTGERSGIINVLLGSLDDAVRRAEQAEAGAAELRAALTTIGDWRLDKAVEHLSRLVALVPEEERPLVERYCGWFLMVREMIDAALEDQRGVVYTE